MAHTKSATAFGQIVDNLYDIAEDCGLHEDWVYLIANEIRDNVKTLTGIDLQE